MFIGLVQMIVVLIILGIILWAVFKYIPGAATFAPLIYALVAIVFILFLCSMFGVFGGGPIFHRIN